MGTRSWEQLHKSIFIISKVYILLLFYKSNFFSLYIFLFVIYLYPYIKLACNICIKVELTLYLFIDHNMLRNKKSKLFYICKVNYFTAKSVIYGLVGYNNRNVWEIINPHIYKGLSSAEDDRLRLP